MTMKNALTLSALAALMVAPLYAGAQDWQRRGSDDRDENQSRQDRNRGSENRDDDLNRRGRSNRNRDQQDRRGSDQTNRNRNSDWQRQQDDQRRREDQWRQDNQRRQDDQRRRDDQWRQENQWRQQEQRRQEEQRRREEEARRREDQYRRDNRNYRYDNRGYDDSGGYSDPYYRGGYDPYYDNGYRGGYGYSNGNQWRDIAIAAGATAVIGLLEHDDFLVFSGASGALYALWRYDQDRNSNDPYRRARARYFDQAYFMRNGHRYERREVDRDGDRYYQFVRCD